METLHYAIRSDPSEAIEVSDLRRRLDRIEVARHTCAPTAIVADYPIEDDEADAALAAWRIRVAQGRASARNGVLYLTEGAELTEAEWITRHVTPH